MNHSLKVTTAVCSRDGRSTPNPGDSGTPALIAHDPLLLRHATALQDEKIFQIRKAGLQVRCSNAQREQIPDRRNTSALAFSAKEHLSEFSAR